VTWSGGGPRALEGVTGTGPWDRLGADRVAVRWGDGHAGTGTPRAASVLTTAMPLTPPQLVASETTRGAMAPTGPDAREDLQRASPTGSGHAPVLQLPPGPLGV
jgi:hypothetical protein